MTERDYLTVSEYAKLKGITRQSAYCHDVVKYDNAVKAKIVKLSDLSIDDADKARQIIDNADSKAKSGTAGTTSTTEQLITALQGQVATLTEQLRIKDEQIKDLNQRLSETLAVVYKQYVDEQPKPLQGVVADQDAVPVADDHPQQDNQPTSKAGKVSFWDRLFHRNDAV